MNATGRSSGREAVTRDARQRARGRRRRPTCGRARAARRSGAARAKSGERDVPTNFRVSAAGPLRSASRRAHRVCSRRSQSSSSSAMSSEQRRVVDPAHATGLDGARAERNARCPLSRPSSPTNVRAPMVAITVSPIQRSASRTISTSPLSMRMRSGHRSPVRNRSVADRAVERHAVPHQPSPLRLGEFGDDGIATLGHPPIVHHRPDRGEARDAGAPPVAGAPEATTCSGRDVVGMLHFVL